MAKRKVSKQATGTTAIGKKVKPEPGDSPITVGGGGGETVGFTVIGFNLAYYKDKPKPRKWEHKGASLEAVLLYADGILLPAQPTVKPNSVVIIRCACVSGQSDIVITGKDLGIDVPVDCTSVGGGTFYCSGCSIIEVFVDGKSVFSTVDGNCSVRVLNR